MRWNQVGNVCFHFARCHGHARHAYAACPGCFLKMPECMAAELQQFTCMKIRPGNPNCAPCILQCADFGHMLPLITQKSPFSLFCPKHLPGHRMVIDHENRHVSPGNCDYCCDVREAECKIYCAVKRVNKPVESPVIIIFCPSQLFP